MIIPVIIIGVNGSNPIIVGRTGILFFDTSNYGKILSVEVNERVFNSLRTVDTFYFRLDIIAEEVE